MRGRTEQGLARAWGEGDIPRAAACGLLAGALVAIGAGAAGAQAAPRLPFFAGERLEFAARVAKVRASGTGTMWVEGPVDVRGSQTLRLRFDFSARVGPVKAEDRTESWLDPRRMAALRFQKHERHVLAKHDERVELFPEERRWAADDGTGGASPTDAPLDELSFMYFLRTLPLDADTVMRFDRHFDRARSPTTVRVIGRDTVATPAGTFRGVVVEMKVKDPRRYRGEGTIRITLSDDAARIPLRIESQMPVVGAAVLTLRKHNQPADRTTALLAGPPQALAAPLASAAP